MYAKKNNGEIHLALIEAQSDLADCFTSMAKSVGAYPHTYICHYDEMQELAKNIAVSTDAIFCRSGTAEYVNDVVSIPVISIPITPFDVFLALSTVEAAHEHIAFFNYQRSLSSIKRIESFFTCTIHQYVFNNVKDDIYMYGKKAKELGVRYCIGGTVTMRMAKDYEMEGIKISPNEDSVYRSIHEAIRVIEVQRKELSVSARLGVIFDSITEGIIVTDETNNIITRGFNFKVQHPLFDC